MKKQTNIYLFFLCVFIFIFILYRKTYIWYEMNRTNTYSIATIYRVELGDFCICYYNIEYQNKIFKGETTIPARAEGLLYNVKIGERYLVKISKEDFTISELQFEHLVPECIKKAPSEGWEGIPDSSKMCE